MRYDDPRGSSKGHRPEGIPAVAMETQTAEEIEEESIGGDSEVEVLEPLEGHIIVGIFYIAHYCFFFAHCTCFLYFVLITLVTIGGQH